MEEELFIIPLYEKFSEEESSLDSSSSTLYIQNSDEKNTCFIQSPSSSNSFHSVLPLQYKYDSINHIPSLRLNESKASYIGRSSQSCTLSISKNNKFVSRIHAKIEYHPENKAIYITCLGWNGMVLYVRTEHEPRKIKKNQTSVIEWTRDIGSIVVEVAGSFSRILWPISLEVSVDDHTDIDKIYLPCTTNDENIPPSQKTNYCLKHCKDKVERAPLNELIHENLENTKICDSVTHSDSSSFSQFVSLNDNKDEVLLDNAQSFSSDLNCSGSDDNFIDSGLLDCVLTILTFSPLSAIPSSTLTHLFPSTFSKEDVEEWLRNVGQFIAEIKREGKDASGKLLESEWYYLPEKDDNEERRARLQPFIKPIRQSRKMHKQYYWKKPKMLTLNNMTSTIMKKKNRKK
ncbi:hypothetical protein PORY_002648 [Pneumocystis oryctolagi]|uniref:Uncharacterized protein n=1 Tax=Pneumocystis oryctolagi TaxID=42067 RepID=A0ACB7C982_9ASCO|nr:hypothetical protein PORY_002648 [Pneumocystis oryctolagi]